MSRLDKIKSQILEEAVATARERIGEAEEKAKAIVELAKKEAEAESEGIRKRSKSDAESYLERTASSGEMRRRQALLAAKQEVISGVLAKAYRRVISLEDAEYFDMICALLEKNVQPEEGHVRFSAKDLSRLPEGFSEKVSKIAESHGGKLEISNEPIAADGGFVLVYGGIEENCTIKAIFDASLDELSDAVQKLMF